MPRGRGSTRVVDDDARMTPLFRNKGVLLGVVCMPFTGMNKAGVAC